MGSGGDRRPDGTRGYRMLVKQRLIGDCALQLRFCHGMNSSIAAVVRRSTRTSGGPHYPQIWLIRIPLSRARVHFEVALMYKNELPPAQAAYKLDAGEGMRYAFGNQLATRIATPGQLGHLASGTFLTG